MHGRTTFLTLENLHTRLIGISIMHGRSSKVLASIGKIPNDSNEGESSKDDRGVVHGDCVNGDGYRHAEDDDGEKDPHDTNTVDEGTEFAKREGRVLDNLAATDKVDADGDTVGRSQTDGGDTSEGVEGSGGTEVDASENTVDHGGEDESVDGHVETVVNFAPELVSRDSSISGECIGAAGRSGEGANTSKHKDTEDQEEETKATSGRPGNDLEQGTDGLGVGNGEEHLDVRKDEENGDEVDDSSNTSSSDGEDDGLGDLTLRVLDFFTHGSDHAITSENVCACN
jgi:hypothetical protein